MWIHLGKDTAYIIRLINDKLQAFVQAASTALFNEGDKVDPSEVRIVNAMISNIANFGFKTIWSTTCKICTAS
jgi:hypothetical protein